MAANNTAQKIIINTGISITLRVLGSILGLVSIYYLTHYLGNIGYGKYETALTYLYILNTIADLGIYNIVLRENHNEQSVFANALTLRIISLAFFYLLGFTMLKFFPYESEVKIGILVASLYTIGNSISQLIIPVFQKRLNVYFASIYEIIARLIFIIAIVILTYLHKPLVYFLGALSISSLTMLALNYIQASRYLKIYLAFEQKKILYILKEALPLGIIILFVFVYFKLDQLMLSYFKGPREVGIYGLSYKIIENIIFIPGMIMGLIIPIFSKLSASKSKLNEIFNKTLKYFAVISMVIIIILFFFSKLFIRLLAPESFNDSINVLKVLSLALFFIFLGSVSGGIILVFKRQKLSIPAYIIGAVLNVILNLYFIPRYSYFGAAWTTVVTEILVNCSLLYLSLKTSLLSIKLSNLFLIGLVGIFLIIPSLWLPYKEFVGIIAVLMFLATMYWTKIIETNDVKEILNFRKLLSHKI